MNSNLFHNIVNVLMIFIRNATAILTAGTDEDRGRCLLGMVAGDLFEPRYRANAS